MGSQNLLEVLPESTGDWKIRIGIAGTQEALEGQKAVDTTNTPFLEEFGKGSIIATATAIP